MLAQVPTTSTNLQLEQLRISHDWRDWAAAAAILVVAVIVAAVTRRLINRGVARMDGDEHTGRLVGRLVTYAIVTVGVLAALGAVQVRGLGAILGALGIFSIAIAFALRDTLENLLAGLFLGLSRPFRRGDTVLTAGFEGSVEDVTLRNVQLLTSDGELVLIPSATVYKSPITNFSRLGRRRAIVELTLPANVDVAHAKEVMRDAISGVAHVLAEPAPTVLLTSFDDIGIRVSARAWFDTADAPRVVVGDAVACAVKAALDGAGIPLATSAG